MRNVVSRLRDSSATVRGLRGSSGRVDRYTHGHHKSVVLQHAARTAENSAAFLLPELRVGQRLLDVGCGPGSITRGFAQRLGDSGHVTAVDTSQEVLQQAELATKDLGNVTVQQASTYELPFDDASFDIAYAHQVLQHLSDPVRALQEMSRVVRPGGLVAVREADYASMLGNPELPGIDLWRSVYRATCRRNGAEPDAGRHLVKWARAAGFQLESLRYTNSVVCYGPSDQDFRRKWGLAWAERSRVSFGKQAVEYGLASPDDLERMAEAWLQFADNDESVFFYVNGEVLATVP